jgi:hypothetical protein
MQAMSSRRRVAWSLAAAVLCATGLAVGPLSQGPADGRPPGAPPLAESSGAPGVPVQTAPSSTSEEQVPRSVRCADGAVTFSDQPEEACAPRGGVVGVGPETPP